MTKESRVAQSAVSVPLSEIQIQLLSASKTKARARRLLAKYHGLGDVHAVGEQLFYALLDGRGDWLGVLVFCAASRRLRARDQWIGWTEEQRRRRLPLLVNNCRFLLLTDNRAAWGIESGLHQRLDVSHLDDQCRVRKPQSMRVMGMFRRFSNSLFIHWRNQQKKPRHKTTTDFFSAMNAEHHRYAIRCLHARRPSFQTDS